MLVDKFYQESLQAFAAINHPIPLLLTILLLPSLALLYESRVRFRAKFTQKGPIHLLEHVLDDRGERLIFDYHHAVDNLKTGVYAKDCAERGHEGASEQSSKRNSMVANQLLKLRLAF